MCKDTKGDNLGSLAPCGGVENVPSLISDSMSTRNANVSLLMLDFLGKSLLSCSKHEPVSDRVRGFLRWSSTAQTLQKQALFLSLALQRVGSAALCHLPLQQSLK